MRAPIASGKLYESDFTQLNSQIEAAFEQGPGTTPLNIKDNKVIAAIVPNIDYDLSSYLSSWVYKELGESSQPLTYVIIGPSSQQSNKILLSLQDFSTPFGVIKNDKNLVNNLLDSFSIIDENSHNSETSIELQLPFLQYISKKNLENLRILPILIPPLNEDLIKNLATKLSKINNVIFIISSNLLHHGPSYDFTPFKFNIKTELENLNNHLLETILNVNTQEFISIVNKYEIPFTSPIAILLETLRLKNIRKGKVLSKELIEKDEKNLVSIASIIYNET